MRKRRAGGGTLGPGPVLVRLPSWLGDLVMAEPAVRALDARLRDEGRPQDLSLAAPAHLLPLLAGAFPDARRIPHAGRGGERAEDWRGHATALLFTNSFRSAWTARRAGIPRRVGWIRDARGWLLTDGMRPARERGGRPLGLGVVGRRPRLLPRPFGATCVELLGLVGVPVGPTRPRLPLAPGVRDAVDARLAGLGLARGERCVVANVGGRPGSAKAWPLASWVAALDHLHDAGAPPVVLVGGPGEEASVVEVAAGTRARTLSLVDPVADLPELVALAGRAAVFLTADAGPRHVALAAGAPLVVVAGPTDPRHTADHLTRTHLVREPVDCGPCHRERCPLGGARHHACMTGVDPGRVADLALGLL